MNPLKSASTLAAAAAAETGPPPRFWTRILTSTPVVLTVVATVLAGLSSSEMTWAQYHRALAAQNQSKAGDQWSFFQAKRIRGANMEMTIDMLRVVAEPVPIDLASIQKECERLTQELQRGEQSATGLLAVTATAKDKLGSKGTEFQSALARLQQTAAAQAKAAMAAKDQLRHSLATAESAQAVRYLGGERLPAYQPRPTEDVHIQDALVAIRERRPEKDLTPLLTPISQDALQAAVDQAEADVVAVEKSGKPIGDTLRDLDRHIQLQVQPARTFHRAVGEVQSLAGELSPSESTSRVGWRDALASLVGIAAAAKSHADHLANDFKVAYYAFTVQRYDREAAANQNIATIYELQVRKSSITSETHRTRSKHYFYGMLVAQAGVTLASFSLAMKHRNLLWSLATVAGLGAVLFSLWVYLSR